MDTAQIIWKWDLFKQVQKGKEELPLKKIPYSKYVQFQIFGSL